ncbi:hypothetical protein L914_10084 [Phytophthora nicotianae]|uniref:Uncharacterized protein n=2 Tax=Phytophthora nicotianae TaxID=4792 RepID=V9F045_PHYNI|nr:hypothetical protein F443_10466 [Phytophthora nicotianae P1569]ETM44710.1 hypothetical protein L914_10084 [Phytophthora nicotianae]
MEISIEALGAKLEILAEIDKLATVDELKRANQDFLKRNGVTSVQIGDVETNVDPQNHNGGEALPAMPAAQGTYGYDEAGLGQLQSVMVSVEDRLSVAKGSEKGVLMESAAAPESEAVRNVYFGLKTKKSMYLKKMDGSVLLALCRSDGRIRNTFGRNRS